MKEIRSIIEAYDKAAASVIRCALATVVHVEGSSYRRPGARMLITEDGELTGSISGGCLEGDALRKALFVISSAQKMLVTYDTSDEDDAKLGMGLGCQGIIQVLIEPIAGVEGEQLINLLRAAVHERKKSALVTLFSLQNKKEKQQGTCFLLLESGEATGAGPTLKELLAPECCAVLEARQSSFRQVHGFDENLIAFTEILLPEVLLVIAGAGNDVFPLVELADVLGWSTLVVDGRPQFAKKDRFASPSCQVLLSRPENVLNQITIDDRTAIILMSHNYNYDYALLSALAKRQFSYIGVLGPKKKMQMLFDQLEQEGVKLTDRQRANIFGPVGLNIGAETAGEIALSIIAEIKAVFSDTTPRSLRDLPGTIHQRAGLAIETAYTTIDGKFT